MNAVKREPTRRDYYERMLRVLDHIEHNLDGELTLEGLGRVACFSPYHLHYIFRGIVGEGLGREIRDVPCIENYLNQPRDVAAEDLRTEVYVPLQAED